MRRPLALVLVAALAPACFGQDARTFPTKSGVKLEVQTFIREIRETHDATVLLCTHDLVEAEQLAERVGILDRGRLIELAPAEELKSKYGAETLEEAFFAATGKAFEDEPPEEEE